jgi:predicted HAD superfamily Cof-like phosphohydrolase
MVQTYQPVLFEVSPAQRVIVARKARATRPSSVHGTFRYPGSKAFTQPTLPVSPSVLVREFHTVVGGFTSLVPTIDVPLELQNLRLELVREEAQELADALSAHDLVGVADALGDLVYVTFGAALTFGIDLDAVVEEIHRSNMTKIGPDGKPIRRSDGKVLKGPDYSPPCLEPVLARSMDGRCSPVSIIQVAPAS